MRVTDQEAVYEIFSDPAVMRYWGSPPLKDADEAVEFIEENRKSFASRTLFGWSVVLPRHRSTIQVLEISNKLSASLVFASFWTKERPGHLIGS